MTMNKIVQGGVLGVIPARGGSKSVPLKNLAPLAGRPLIDYCITVAQAVMPKTVHRLVCSTDHPAIKDFCLSRSVEVIDRPPEIATDTAPTDDAVRHVLQTIADADGAMPEIVVLFQPTSPFVLPEHINEIVRILLDEPTLDTAQSLAHLPHNMHALNQRIIKDGRVYFRFWEERKLAYNKQLKPMHYRYGNILAFRSETLMAGTPCFGPNCGSFVVDSAYAHDVDGPEDFEYAEFLIEKKKVVVI
jgi:CMP-N,N'-diacetyllegionaminic acid synthase